MKVGDKVKVTEVDFHFDDTLTVYYITRKLLKLELDSEGRQFGVVNYQGDKWLVWNPCDIDDPDLQFETYDLYDNNRTLVDQFYNYDYNYEENKNVTGDI